MDVVECLKSFNKMCDSYESCEDCELNAIRTSFTSCRELLTDNPKEILPIIEKWNKKHLKKTRQEVLKEAVDESYLLDWYISSVMDDEPVWTEKHIEELCHDFYVIPKPNEER